MSNVKLIYIGLGVIEIKLTGKEMEIMAVLWGRKEPITASELIETSSDRTWKENSIYIIMNTLIKKGAVELTYYKPTGTNTARAYKAIITAEDYALSSVASIKKFGKSGIPIDIDVLIKGIREMEEG